jgi:hypothetical protein
MTILNDTDETAVRADRVLAVKKDVVHACPECAPERDGEERPALVLIFPGGDVLVLNYENEDDRDVDYEEIIKS